MTEPVLAYYDALRFIYKDLKKASRDHKNYHKLAAIGSVEGATSRIK